MYHSFTQDRNLFAAHESTRMSLERPACNLDDSEDHDAEEPARKVSKKEPVVTAGGRKIGRRVAKLKDVFEKPERPVRRSKALVNL